jgi:hypothetical protein
VVLRSLLTDAAVGRTSELFAEADPPPTDRGPLFAAPMPDAAGALDIVRLGAG